MGDEATNNAGGAVQQGQAAPSEVGSQGTPSQVPATPSWKVGDTTYDDPNKMHEAFNKFQGEYTRSRQEYSRLRQDSGTGMALLELVQNDPQLLAEVRKRLAAGQSPQQAAEGAVQQQAKDPRVDQLFARVETRDQESATTTFHAAHPELTDEDSAQIEEWVGDHWQRMRKSGYEYSDILDMAYSKWFHEKKGPELLSQGQKMKEAEIQKGAKSQLLGTPSPTAQARAVQKKPGQKMTANERDEYARKLWEKNAKR